MATFTFYPAGFTGGGTPTPVVVTDGISVAQGQPLTLYIQGRSQDASSSPIRSSDLWIDLIYQDSGSSHVVVYDGFDGTYHLVTFTRPGGYTAGLSLGSHPWETRVGWDGSLNSIGGFSFTVTAALSKPTTPTPENDDTEVDFSGFQLGWVDGGGATAYKIYVGPTGNLVQVGSEQSGTSYTTDIDELQTIFDATPIDQKIYWRVDATDGAEWVTGDEWNFDARPGKATTPTPTNAATGQRLFPTYEWTAGAQRTTDTIVITVTGIDPISVTDITTSTYDSAVVTFETNLVWGYNSIYTWRVNSVNQFGTTEGDDWTLNTCIFDPPISSWENLPGKTLGPLTSGVEGTDFRFLGLNCINVVKFLLVAKDQSIYYVEVF